MSSGLVPSPGQGASEADVEHPTVTPLGVLPPEIDLGEQGGRLVDERCFGFADPMCERLRFDVVHRVVDVAAVGSQVLELAGQDQ